MYSMYNGTGKVENNKIAIITGSGMRIGREAAIILAKKSVNVVVCSRSLSEISSTVQEIKIINCNSKVLGISAM
jgi:short-subunit dehydrogenase